MGRSGVVVVVVMAGVFGLRSRMFVVQPLFGWSWLGCFDSPIDVVHEVEDGKAGREGGGAGMALGSTEGKRSRKGGWREGGLVEAVTVGVVKSQRVGFGK